MGIRSRIATGSIAAALAVCLAMPAAAVLITLEDFDGTTDPSVTGTNSSGDVSLSGQALLSTGGLAVPYETSEIDLGLGNKTIDRIYRDYIEKPGFSTGLNPTEGSAYQITFSGELGDVFYFDWTMSTTEPTRGSPDLDLYTDFSWWHIDGPPGQQNEQDGLLARVNDIPSPPEQTFSFTLASTGSYTVTVGVHDVEDTNFDSNLVIDYFRLVRGPEPGTFGTVAGGLLALSWLSRRRQRIVN